MTRSKARETLRKTGCELLSACPFYNDSMHSDMPEVYKEQYCKRDYAWCGRYLTFKALDSELKRDSPAISRELGSVALRGKAVKRKGVGCKKRFDGKDKNKKEEKREMYQISSKDCPIGLDKIHCQNCYFWRDGKCDYDTIIREHSGETG